MAKLRTYRAKRDFGRTPEPRGAAGRKNGYRYVIQKHAATRLHYDLRLELDGVMKSWAVTRGPSLVPGDKRLAIHVEDHPVEYNKFEGTIPKGEYGGGTVMIWDRGRWAPEHDPHKGLKKGHLDFELQGRKLKGHWHLVRMRKRPGERQEPWLLIKATDEFARRASDKDILDEWPDSVATGRTMEEIAGARKKKIWHSNKVEKAEPAKATARDDVLKPTRKSASRSPRRSPRRRQSAERADDDLGAITGVRAARLPGFVAPCLATLTGKAPDSGDWLHEIKFDGYRIQARIQGSSVGLRTRTGLDWTTKFPTVAEALEALAPRDVIIDGEIVSGDDNGVSDFSALQDDLKSGRSDRLVYYAFDLLHLNGYDLTGARLVERKRALRGLLDGLPKNGIIQLSEHFEADGPLMYRHACGLGLEGIVSKRGDAPYRSGRSGDWLKIKCTNSQEFIVVGYEPSDKKSRAIRSLLLGYYDKDGLRYAGRVGTGWGAAKERDLSNRLAPLERGTPPFDAVPEAERRKRVKWTEPRLVVEVDFRGWTGGGIVRQASFKGVREDKPAKQVVREVGQMPAKIKTKQAALRRNATATKGPATARRPAPIAVAGVTLTHPDRIYWEDAGVSKQMLAEYYEQVWDWMRPHVTGRVLALVRCPEGASGQCFFQKHASAGIDTSQLQSVKEPDGEKSIAIDSLKGLVSLAQAGVLEIHLRGSTVDHLEEADRLVFDLDPGTGIGWPEMVEAAHEVRQRLRDFRLESFVKTTGGKGLHVVVPIRFAPWDDAKAFCRRLAEDMAGDRPDRYTATIKKSARRNRIFVDYLRNSREATAIAPFSTRARPGATVATPLDWDELRNQESANFYNVKNLPRRLSRLRRDPWKDIGRIKQRLPAPGPRKRRAA